MGPFLLVIALLFFKGVSGADPAISNIVVCQHTGGGLVDITYDLHSTGTAVSVYVMVSTNNGVLYGFPAVSFSGDGYGPAVVPGIGKRIVWRAADDWAGDYSTQIWFRLTASLPPRQPYLPPFYASGGIVFTPGIGYSALNPGGEPLYKRRDGERWTIVLSNGQEPALAALTSVVVKSVDLADFRLADGTVNGWSLFNLNAVLNGTDANPAYSGQPGTPPCLGGHHPINVAGQWGYSTTWKGGGTPPQAEEFIAYNDPLYGLPSVIVSGGSCVATNGVWAQGPAGWDTRYCFLRKKLLTVQVDEINPDLSGDLDFGTIPLSGATDQDLTIYLRKPNGERVLVYDDATQGAGAFDTASGAGGGPGNQLRICADAFDLNGDYYLELYATSEIFSPPGIVPYSENFDAFQTQTLYDGGLPVSWQGWTFAAGDWAIDNYDTAYPYPSGAPAGCSPRILVQRSGVNGWVFRGSENGRDYALATTAGKAQTDNDELRWWVRLNGNGTDNPETGNGYMFFLNAGGGSTLGPDRLSGDTIGITRWVRGSGATTVVSNAQAPLPGVSVSVAGGTGNAQADLQSWFHAVNPRNNQSNGFTLANDLAEFVRVRIECQNTQLCVYVSPHLIAPDDPLGTNAGIDTNRLGIAGGNTLLLKVTDTNYLGAGKPMERGRVALQTVSQVAWYDHVTLAPLRTNGDRGLRVDAEGTARVEFVRASDVVLTSRYEVADDGSGTWIVLDRFGSGFNAGSVPPQLSNADRSIWNDPATPGDESADNVQFKDYRPNLGPGAGVWVQDLDQIPTFNAVAQPAGGRPP
jgi:hypothetical protein